MSPSRHGGSDHSKDLWLKRQSEGRLLDKKGRLLDTLEQAES